MKTNLGAQDAAESGKRGNTRYTQLVEQDVLGPRVAEEDERKLLTGRNEERGNDLFKMEPSTLQLLGYH